MTFGRWYKRWRHGRGFGVHSPLAYAVVMETLRPQHGYAYHAELDTRLGGGIIPHERARQIVRLAAFVDARSANISAVTDQRRRTALRDILRAYYRDIRFVSDAADIIITESETLPALPAGGDKPTLLIAMGLDNPTYRQAMEQALKPFVTDAITIDNVCDSAVTIFRRSLPRQTIEVAF